MAQQLAPLQGDVKHYDWGGHTFIPSLLQIENPNMKPHAEYWMGVHPQANCIVTFDDGQEILLKDFVANNAQKVLGQTVYETFGNMPFLLKVLDVKDMLSIQVHPSKKQAAIDFEEENKKGIPLNAPERNYKDANHKPELMVALSDFYLLHGFKPEEELLAILNKVPELNIFIAVFKKEGYEGLYKMAMELPQEEVNELLQPLINRIIPQYQQDHLQKDDENFWAARAALTFVQPNIIDRGIFSIYFFNLLHLNQGEAIFQDAGMPHAYLEGYNVEIMASSDNVLRGGLTTKHINTVELLKHTKCRATNPKIIKAKNKQLQVYQTPVNDFELSSYQLKKGEQVMIDVKTAEILLLTRGKVQLVHKKNKVTLQTGNISAAAFSGAAIEVTALEDSLLFRAGTPL